MVVTVLVGGEDPNAGKDAAAAVAVNGKLPPKAGNDVDNEFKCPRLQACAKLTDVGTEDSL